jgi:hypothetical protein
LLIILILFFASSAACFGLCGFKYDYDSDTATGHLNSLPLFVSGIVLFLLSVIYGIYVAIYLPILFKESRSLYMQTNQYQENVKRLAMMDLSKLTTKEIKWNYKLGFINKTTFLYHKHQLKKAKRN